MHELGIVFHIARKVESVAAENGISRVAKVILEIGEVSTIVPSYLQDCWKWKCTKSDVLKECELEVEMIPAVTFCEDCEQTYGTVEYGKTCPYCGSANTYLVQANEHEIKEIVVYETEQDKTDAPAGKEKAAHGPLPPQRGTMGRCPLPDVCI